MTARLPKLSPLDIARAAWGDNMPAWIETLATACNRTSQARVAVQLDRTASMISQLLHNKYPASTANIEDRVRGVFMNGLVQCPALGAMPTDICQNWRVKSKTFVPGNPTRVTLYRACHKCPRFLETAE